MHLNDIPEICNQIFIGFRVDILLVVQDANGAERLPVRLDNRVA